MPRHRRGPQRGLQTGCEDQAGGRRSQRRAREPRAHPMGSEARESGPHHSDLSRKKLGRLLARMAKANGARDPGRPRFLMGL
jgi:hypothetical protein